MIEIEKPRIERVEIGENNRYGKFVVEPLERGFGQTLGNSLRRVLLNSLPGVAVTSVRIEGVQHEFSTVPGVKEDVAEIILNLKNLSAKLFSDQPKIITVDAVGPCEVTAAEIKCDEEVEIVNPDLHIATLTEGAHLQMQVTLDKGRGYVSVERNKQIMTERSKSVGLPSLRLAIFYVLLVMVGVTLARRGYSSLCLSERPRATSFCSTSSSDFLPKFRTFIMSS